MPAELLPSRGANVRLLKYRSYERRPFLTEPPDRGQQHLRPTVALVDELHNADTPAYGQLPSDVTARTPWGGPAPAIDRYDCL